MWSKGLGKIELVVDFSHYKVVSEDSATVIKGVTNEPVQWNFTITLEQDDIAGLLNVLFKRKTLLFTLRNFRIGLQFVYQKLFQRHKFTEFDRESSVDGVPINRN